MKDIIIDLQSSETWKIQLTIANNFICSKDTEEERVSYSISDNVEFTPYNNANEVVNKLFEALHSKCQGNLETSMRESDLIFDSVQIMYCKLSQSKF